MQVEELFAQNGVSLKLAHLIGQLLTNFRGDLKIFFLRLHELQQLQRAIFNRDGLKKLLLGRHRNFEVSRTQMSQVN